VKVVRKTAARPERPTIGAKSQCYSSKADTIVLICAFCIYIQSFLADAQQANSERVRCSRGCASKFQSCRPRRLGPDRRGRCTFK